MNKFSNYETVERKLLNELMLLLTITGFTLSTIGDYSRTDGEYNDGEKVRFEIKVRNFSKNKYNDYLLEFDKLEQLYNFYKSGYDRIEYINFFNEGNGEYSCIIFDLKKRVKMWLKDGKKVNDIFYSKYLPSSTAINRGWRYKKVTMLIPNKYDKKIDRIITKK